jgi:hypothetical protein
MMASATKPARQESPPVVAHIRAGERPASKRPPRGLASGRPRRPREPPAPGTGLRRGRVADAHRRRSPRRHTPWPAGGVSGRRRRARSTRQRTQRARLPIGAQRSSGARKLPSAQSRPSMAVPALRHPRSLTAAVHEDRPRGTPRKGRGRVRSWDGSKEPRRLAPETYESADRNAVSSGSPCDSRHASAT